MSVNPIGIAVPFFLLLIGIEYLVLRRQKRTVRLNDAVTDMSSGLGDQALSIFFKTFTLIPYSLLFESYALVEMPTSAWWTWVFGAIVVDFAYYWYHRISHRVNLFWATHAVHHQSEEYNLSVALRQPWFSNVYSWIIYLPLAVLGVPLEVFVTTFAFNLLYQFWIHTETIDRMGTVFEWVFNTPSHHRVHHGTNPEYVDKNYAGILIIWDRMFGTFQVEVERPLYGTLKPLRSWNAAWANVQPWIALGKASVSQARWIDRVKIWFMPPGWTPEGETDPAELFDCDDRGYDVDEAPKNHAYIFLNLAIMGSMLGVMLTFESQIPYLYHAVGGLFILWSVIAWSGLFEGKRWGWPLEYARVTAILLVGGLFILQ